MSATRYGGRRVNDVLVRSNILQGRKTADAEASAVCLRQHRATGYAALEMMKPWKLRSPGNFHQQPFGLGIAAQLHTGCLRSYQLRSDEPITFRLWQGK